MNLIPQNQNQNQNQIQNQIQVPQPQAPQMIVIKLPAKTKLSYTVQDELGGGINHLILKDNFNISIPEGFQIEFGTGYFYRVVHQPRRNIIEYPQNQISINFKITLPAGTKVFMGDGIGIPVTLSDPFEVSFSHNTNIKLLADTIIQHTNTPSILKLYEESDAILMMN